MLARKFPAAPEARLVQYYVLDYAGSEAALAARDRLSSDSRFEYVARDPLAEPAAIPAEWYVGPEPSGSPRGTYQWGFHALRFGDAFEKYTGSARVGVVDYGIALDNPAIPGQFHRDLRKNFRAHLSRNFTDVIAVGLPPEARLSGNIVDAAYRPIGDYPLTVVGPFAGHGTHVAGIIAADWNEGSEGVVGGCPDCSLLVGKVDLLGLSSIGAAIGYLVDVGVTAINMSLEMDPACASDAEYQDFRDALAKARAADVALVAAAGNQRNAFLACPADQSGVIAAGGLQSDLQSNLSF